MKTFRNKNFVKRNYECTNTVFCQAEKSPNENYIETTEADLTESKCQALYTENDVRYFGFL